MGNRRHERIPAMDYRQYRRARRLVRECCNYDNGQCMALDEGDGCVCVQSISHSLLCRWFRAAVLPLDHQLETALYHRLESRRCSECGALFLPGSNRAKYCKDCATRMKRKHAAERKRKQRRLCHALGAEKTL
ncbi:cysteine-rich VLP domain-containing protein [Lachnospiraceae bacterium 66-29]